MADEYDFFGYSVVFLCGNWVKWQHHLENEGTREAENSQSIQNQIILHASPIWFKGQGASTY